MSQITRCPFCETKFKVVADQLRISDGWVRCGQCKEIFDATDHLQSVPDTSGHAVPAPQHTDAASTPAIATAALPSPLESLADGLEVPVPTAKKAPDLGTEAPKIPKSPVANDSAPPPIPPKTGKSEHHPEGAMLPPKGYELPSAPLPELDLEWFDASELDFGPTAAPPPQRKSAPEKPPDVPSTTAPPPSGGAATAPVTPVVPQPAALAPAAPVTPVARTPSFLPERQEPYLVPEPLLGELPPVSPVAPPLAAEPAPKEPTSPQAAAIPAPASAPMGQEELSFVRAAQHKNFWGSRAMRIGLLLASVLLLCGLALQVLVHQRNVLAATHPEWRPWLQALCVPLQCKLGPHRQIASVVVDSSSFNKIRGDEYQFGITLKNRSSMALEMPAVELTLTDANDHPVLRRVFTRQDLQAPAELPAQGEWSTSLLTRLSTGGSMLASGYRVLAFYP